MGRVTKQYRVVFLGIMNDEETFRNNMVKLGVSYTDLDKYIKNTPVVLKRDLRLADARKYADAIIYAGGLVNIQETGEFPEPHYLLAELHSILARRYAPGYSSVDSILPEDLVTV